MEFTVSIEGHDPDSPRLLVCPGRSSVILQVTWVPPSVGDDKHASEPPVCTLSYLATPGAYTGGLPTSAALTQKDAEPRAWRASIPLHALAFSPLRVRVELQPAFGRSHVDVVHIVPVTSAWTATGLVIATLVTVATLMILTLATLRLTVTQAATGFAATAVLAAAWKLLVRTLSTLNPGHLPFLGVTYLIHRAALACALGILGVIAVLQSCVVAIHNDTPGELRLVLPWRDSEEPIAPHGRISVVPPDGRSFRGRVLDHLPEDARSRPFCIDDGSGSDDPTACRRDAPATFVTLGARLRGLFTPPTVTIRCGRRWSGLSPANTIDPPPGVRLEGDDVWFEPPPAATCERGDKAQLWFDVKGAAHRVRYPWQPKELDAVGRLSLDPDDEDQSAAEVTFVSVGDEAGDLQETRISLAPGRALERDGWPIAGLTDASKPELKLQIGDLLRRPNESFSFAAELECRRSQARGTMFHATRLELLGAPGWLGRLDSDSRQALGWHSSWTLARSVGTQAAVPWVCEALPGDRPQLAKRVGFAASKLELFVDERDEAREGEQTLVVPAYLMSRSIEVKRQGTGGGSVGSVECMLDVGERARVGLVRVQVEDHRNGEIRRISVARPGDKQPLARWNPESPAAEGQAGGDGRPFAWFCWDFDAPPRREVELEVTSLDAHEGPIPGRWDVSAGVLTLRARGKKMCYYNKSRGLSRERPPGVELRGRPTPATDYRNTLPDAKACDAIQQYVPHTKGEP